MIQEIEAKQSNSAPMDAKTAAQVQEWNKAWKAHGYEVFITADGSPTLQGDKESMHHRGGAYNETQLVYGDPLRDCLDYGGSAVFSLGLGLGYNEFLMAAECLIWNMAPDMTRLVSYEADPTLTAAMLDCIHGKHTALSDIYFSVMELYEKKYRLPPGLLQMWLKEAYEMKKWEIRGALKADSRVGERFHCVLYDAFSAKTSPELWTEEFLTRFFAQNTAPQSWISTYACTGNLKRALKLNHFDVILREGFHGKRNSTLGTRGLLSL